MTKEQFVKNNRAVHGSRLDSSFHPFPWPLTAASAGEEISVDFLEKLYDSIISEEIKVDGSLNFFQNAEKTGWLTKQAPLAILPPFSLSLCLSLVMCSLFFFRIQLNVCAQGGRIKSWKKRWFVLTGNCLLYFREPAVQGNEKPLGIIPLENLAVRVVSKEVSKHIFELYHPEHTSELMKAVKRDSEGALVQSNHERYLIRGAHLLAIPAPSRSPLAHSALPRGDERMGAGNSKQHSLYTHGITHSVEMISGCLLPHSTQFELINRRKKARAGQRGSAGFSS